ncbi:ATP-grasp domain-containing protein [Streptomyces sp. NPDC046924]|uniref:ATP-grasp domain-containing protein n=1 Tax=Streptomyces sp. NPDC046924 TaxID=3155136 RepID=UPI00340523DD
MTPSALDLSKVTHVVVGIGMALLTDLDRLLPEGSVLVLDEAETVEARQGKERVSRFACVAGLLEAPTQDEANAERLLETVPRPEGIRAVLPALEYGVVAAAALAAGWGVPGAGTGAARALRDKAVLRETAGAHGIDQPRWEILEGPEGIDAFRSAFGGRCVVKPANRQASLGVRLLDAGPEAPEVWADLTAADERTQRARYALPPKYLVEQRLEGPEFSVEALVSDGAIVFANVTGKNVLHGDRPVELGHVVPAPLSPDLAEALVDATRRLMDATGFTAGMVHAEWILHGGRPHLVECAGRLPGDRIHHLINLSHSCDLTAEYLRVLEGRAPTVQSGAPRAAAIRFLTAGPGTVSAVDGVDEARRVPGVDECQVYVEPGAEVREVASSWDRLGHVVAVGADAGEAASRAEDAASRIRFVLGTSA